MKSKLESDLDKEFDKLGIKIRIYHFTDVANFNAITIATNNNLNWNDISKQLSGCSKFIFERQFNHARLLIYELGNPKTYGYGVSICDKRDQFDRRKGRIIAKGRLLKILKKNAET